MAKYHINSKGIPAICKAEKGNCPFGGDGEHYDTKEAAQAAADERNKEQFGILSANTELITSHNVTKPNTKDKQGFYYNEQDFLQTQYSSEQESEPINEQEILNESELSEQEVVENIDTDNPAKDSTLRKEKESTKEEVSEKIEEYFDKNKEVLKENRALADAEAFIIENRDNGAYGGEKTIFYDTIQDFKDTAEILDTTVDLYGPEEIKAEVGKAKQLYRVVSRIFKRKIEDLPQHKYFESSPEEKIVRLQSFGNEEYNAANKTKTLTVDDIDVNLPEEKQKKLKEILEKHNKEISRPTINKDNTKVIQEKIEEIKRLQNRDKKNKSEKLLRKQRELNADLYAMGIGEKPLDMPLPRNYGSYENAIQMIKLPFKRAWEMRGLPRKEKKKRKAEVKRKQLQLKKDYKKAVEQNKILFAQNYFNMNGPKDNQVTVLSETNDEHKKRIKKANKKAKKAIEKLLNS